MIALLGLWKAKALGAVSGTLAQAIAVATAIALVVGSIGFGIWWLREDARLDERHAWELKMEKARIGWLVVNNRRQTQASQIAQEAMWEWAQERTLLEAANRDLADQIAWRPRTVCYPKDIIKALNR